MHDEENDGGDGHFTRVRLNRVLSDLRHLDASHEPARVLAGLAQICVPEVCDECLIEVTEQGMNRYRIRRTGPGLVSIASGNEGSLLECAAAELPGEQADPFGVIVDVEGPWVRARFGSGLEPSYDAVLICRWHTDYLPAASDSALIGVLVDHAVALVHRERTARAGRMTDGAGPTLPVGHRIAAASGILMALYHLSPTQARQLLTRASEHNSRSLGDVADTVLRTGALPPPGSSSASRAR
jgi:hypothetical protein